MDLAHRRTQRHGSRLEDTVVKEADGEVCVGLWGGELGRHEAVVVDSAGASAGSRSAGAAAEVDVQTTLPCLAATITHCLHCQVFFLLLDQSLLSMGNFSVTLVLDGWIAHLRSAPNGTKK
jgi:hypothetical protein